MKKILLQLISTPPICWYYSSLIILALFYPTTSVRFLLGFALASALLGLILNRRCAGRIPFIMRRLSSCFYGIRCLSGRWAVFQMPMDTLPCDKILRTLVTQTQLADELPAGRYRANTHDIVLKRLQANPTIRITRCKKAYCADLRSILNGMTNKRCKACQHPCSAYNAPPRQFYTVSFTKIQNE